MGRVARAALLFVVALVMTAPFTRLEAKMKQDRLTLVTAGGERVIEIEVADTPIEKARGLMFRTLLPDNKGMLFPYDSADELRMWMKNTYIPLDMVFIKADGRVHRIEVRTEPMSEKIIASDGPVKAVLELAGGAAARLGLKPGDLVRHATFGTN